MIHIQESLISLHFIHSTSADSQSFGYTQDMSNMTNSFSNFGLSNDVCMEHMQCLGDELTHWIGIYIARASTITYTNDGNYGDDAS